MAEVVLRAMQVEVSFFIVIAILLLLFNRHLLSCHTKLQYNVDTTLQV